MKGQLCLSHHLSLEEEGGREGVEEGVKEGVDERGSEGGSVGVKEGRRKRVRTAKEGRTLNSFPKSRYFVIRTVLKLVYKL